MKRNINPVLGVSALSPRLTPVGAAIVALMIALPCGAIISLIDWLL